jgi:excisionase family DNA binding protein
MNLNTTVYYTVEEAAGILGVTKDWLWAQCRNRQVPHHKRGRNYRFTAGDLEAIDSSLAPVPVEVAQ